MCQLSRVRCHLLHVRNSNRKSHQPSHWSYVMCHLIGVICLSGTVVKPGSSLCGLTPKVFCLILSFVTEIFLYKVFKCILRVSQSSSNQKALKTLILTSTASSATTRKFTIYKGSQGAIVKLMGIYKGHFLVNWHDVALDSVKVKL